MNLEVGVEDSSNRGRLDIAVRTADHLYLFEFKLARAGSSGAPLAQLQERDYGAKYRHLGLSVRLVGVEFRAQTRNLEVFDSALS